MSSEPVVQAPPRPLHIVGVSLGSATRDHRVRLTLLGREVLAERVGVPDLMAFRRKLLELDGRVDAIGIGGANLALGAGGRIYPIRDIVRLVRGIRTPIVDGSGLKSLLEKYIIQELLPKQYGVDLRGRRVLLVSSVDRFGMAEAFTRAGAELRRRGVRLIVTLSPNLGGRSFGTNVVQAILVAISGRRPEDLTPQDYLDLMRRVGFKPRVEILNP